MRELSSGIDPKAEKAYRIKFQAAASHLDDRLNGIVDARGAVAEITKVCEILGAEADKRGDGDRAAALEKAAAKALDGLDVARPMARSGETR